MARAGLTPARLAAAAAELADTDGLAAVTVAAVARRVGVAPPSVYSHVASADDLLAGVTLLALAELADRGDAAVAGRSGAGALVALAEVYRGYAREHPGRYEAARRRLDPAVAATGAGPRHAELLRAVLRGYGLGGEDQTHAVRLVGSVVHGFTSLELAGGFDASEPDPGRSWRRALEGLDLVLRSWAQPPGTHPDQVQEDAPWTP